MDFRSWREREWWRNYTEWPRRIVFSDDLAKRGIPRNLLANAVDVGDWVRVCPGVFRKKDVTLTYQERVAITARKHPNAILCLTTNLWLTTTQLAFEPREVWIALPRGSRAPRDHELGIRCIQLSPPYLNEGVKPYRLLEYPARRYSTPKTAIDCFKFREHVGIGVAVSALRFCLNHLTTREEMIRLARVGRVEEIVRSHIASWMRNDWVEDPDSTDHDELTLSEEDPLAPGRKPGRPKKVEPEQVFRKCPWYPGCPDEPDPEDGPT